MSSGPQDGNRRKFLRDGVRVVGLAALGTAGGFLAGRRGHSQETRWQLDPNKCIACGNCATHCVLDESAVKCVQFFDMCGYCEICTGYFDPNYRDLNTAAENQMCPTGAVVRRFVEEKSGQKFFEYTIDADACIGCGKCVKGCALMNGSLYLQVSHDRCLNCNECAIGVACPTQAFDRLPADQPHRLKAPALALLKQKANNSQGQARAPPAASPRRMTKSAKIATAFVLAFGLVQYAGADLIPTPDFSDHPIPSTQVPSPRGQWRLYLDVAALFTALCLSTYFALVSRSRNKLLVLTIASLVWFGFVRGGCVCAIGATQNVALAAVNPSYAVPVSVIAFFTLPLVFTLFFGRTFCAAVCPLGAVQELVSVRSVRMPSWLDQSLGLFAYFYLGAAVILAATNTAFIICRYDPFVAFFRLSGSTPMLVFGGCVLAIGVFVGRPYCRYLCPYGAILRVLSRFSKWHVRIPPESCINCRLCEDVCPYDAIQSPSVPQAAEERSKGKRRLAGMLILAPVLVVVGGLTGSLLGEPLARWHPEVRLAEQLRKDELGLASETTDAADAFRSAGRPVREAYASAIGFRQNFRILGIWLGAWVGLVIAAKLIQLSLRRRRSEHQPNRSGCVSCGRCFWYCPVEQVRLGLITDVCEVVPEAKP